jgi:F420-dependent oxidoreductase-like protein
VKLATLVTGVTYRHPGLLAKIVTTLDVLSEGRAMLGIGAAWYDREHHALGVPFPPLSERFERLEEAIQIALQMWSDDEGPFDGTHYQLAETICRPSQIQRPHPPVLIGGSGEQKTLRLVAKYADACNLIGVDPDGAARKLEILAQHCEAEGRDIDEIEKTVQGSGVEPLADVDAFLSMAEAYSAVGIDHIHLRAATPDPTAFVLEFGEKVAPRLAEIG